MHFTLIKPIRDETISNTVGESDAAVLQEESATFDPKNIHSITRRMRLYSLHVSKQTECFSLLSDLILDEQDKASSATIAKEVNTCMDGGIWAHALLVLQSSQDPRVHIAVWQLMIIVFSLVDGAQQKNMIHSFNGIGIELLVSGCKSNWVTLAQLACLAVSVFSDGAPPLKQAIAQAKGVDTMIHIINKYSSPERRSSITECMVGWACKALSNLASEREISIDGDPALNALSTVLIGWSSSDKEITMEACNCIWNILIRDSHYAYLARNNPVLIEQLLVLQQQQGSPSLASRCLQHINSSP